MENCNSPLAEQFRLYERQAEPWKKPHEQVMRSYERADELGEAVAFGLFLHDRIRDRGAPRLGQGLVTVDKALRLYDELLWWYKNSHPLLVAVDKSESDEFPVSRSDDFRQRYEETSRIMGYVTRHRAALIDVKEGRGIALEKAVDELLRNRRSNGVQQAAAASAKRDRGQD